MKKKIKESFIFIFIFITIISLMALFMNSRISPFGYNEARYPNIQKATSKSDLIFLGSSQTYSAFNPEIFDKNLGIHSYNLGTPAEVPVITYYRFEEAIKKSNPKVVIVDIYFRILRYDIGFEYIPQWIGSVSTANKKRIINELPLKNKLKLYFNLTNMDRNLSELLRSFSKGRLTGYKGFVSIKQKTSLEKLEEENRFEDYVFQTNEYVQKNVEYLDKIIDLAKERDIRLIFITTPLASNSFEKIEKYDEIYNFINDHLKARNVEYYDFNIIKNPVFIDEEDFEDGNHLNYYGATKISEYISKEILKEEMFQ